MLLMVLSILVSLPINAQLHGTSPNWTEPVQLPKSNPLADATKGSTGQNLVRLSTGEIIQLYYETDGSVKRFYFAISKDDGNTWQLFSIDTPLVYTGPISGIYSPTFCRDSEDNIHVVWITQPKKHIYYAKFDRNFNILIDTIRITKFIYHDFIEAVYITADMRNRIHVMWHDGDVRNQSNSTYFAKVMYRQSPDGGLTWKEQIILSDTTIYKHSAFPRANFSGCWGDTIAIPWRQEVSSNNWDVWIAVSVDGGNSWNRIPVGNTDSMEWDPGVVVDKNNRIHLHYHEYKKGNFLMSSIEYTYSDDAGLTWSPIITLSPRGIRSQLSVFAYNPEADVQAICWKDERDFVNAKDTRADVMCTFTTDGGQTWQEPEFVTDLDTIPVGYKSVEVGNNGNIYVTFEFRDSISGRKSIWFSEREIVSYVDNVKQDRVVIHVKANMVEVEIPDRAKLPVDIVIVDNSGRIVKKESAYSKKKMFLSKYEFPMGNYALQIIEHGTGKVVGRGVFVTLE